MASAAIIGPQNPKLFVEGKCFNDCEAKLIVGEEGTVLYVCMEQLAHLSEYFRAMFFGDFKEKYKKEFQINGETTDDMVSFFNAIDPDPNIQNISDDSIELLMRLADKYQCDVLKEKLKFYIAGHCYNQYTSASTILNWLIWSSQYHMPDEVVKMCCPAVACLPLSTLHANQEKIGLDLCNKMVDAKCKVFLSEYEFYLDRCTRCYNCTKKQVRCHCSPEFRRCRSCYDIPTSDRNKEQCFCARLSYRNMFN